MKTSLINNVPSKSPIPNPNLKVAIVHDWLYGGGAEKVVLELHRLFPDAPIYTSYCTDEWRNKLDNKVITGYLDKPPFRQLRKFLPILRQHWFKSLKLDDYDIVISSSGNGEAKFIRTKGTHICYCHTPTHFYWRHYNQYLSRPGFRPYWLARIGLRILLKPLRKADYQAAQKIDHFIANSTHIQNDIKQFYNRDSTVIHPPVDIERFSNLNNGKRHGFVTLGRQTPYKRIDIIIQACNELGLPLTVIGNGPEHARLKAMAGPTITFMKKATDSEVEHALSSAEAFIFAAHEDFGIAPVEAMAAGTPVIAYKAGGALDYVQPGVTGVFFEEQTAESLQKVLSTFSATNYDPKTVIAATTKFNREVFQQKISEYLKTIS